MSVSQAAKLAGGLVLASSGALFATEALEAHPAGASSVKLQACKTSHGFRVCVEETHNNSGHYIFKAIIKDISGGNTSLPAHISLRDTHNGLAGPHKSAYMSNGVSFSTASNRGTSPITGSYADAVGSVNVHAHLYTIAKSDYL
jgi:hypothetical protein